MQISINGDSYFDLLKNAEKEILYRALIAYKYNISQTAKAMQLSRFTLRKKIKQYFPEIYY